MSGSRATAPGTSRAIPPAGFCRARAGLPLSELHLARLAELERFVGREAFLGWGMEGDGFFVDVLRPGFTREDAPPAPEGSREPAAAVRRTRGETLHQAIGRALREARRLQP